MTKDEALKKMYQLLMTESHAPMLCDQLESITREALAQSPEPRNFCPRCGKRTADLNVIHTCTPPPWGEPNADEIVRSKKHD
jgi:hypothetical protein